MKKAFTHEYFIIRRKQHNLGSPDTCLVLDDFLLLSCSAHLSLTSLPSSTLRRDGGGGGRGETRGALGQSPATALTPAWVPLPPVAGQPGDEPRARDPPAPVMGGSPTSTVCRVAAVAAKACFEG